VFDGKFFDRLDEMPALEANILPVSFEQMKQDELAQAIPRGAVRHSEDFGLSTVGRHWEEEI
jgi:hypothetical protein